MGEGVAELSPLDPIIDSCPDKNFHNWDFGRKFEKTQGLDDALRRWLGGVGSFSGNNSAFDGVWESFWGLLGDRL